MLTKKEVTKKLPNLGEQMLSKKEVTNELHNLGEEEQQEFSNK